MKYVLQERAMSPHAVDWAAGALEDGVACGAGAGLASETVAKRAWNGRAQVKRMVWRR